MSNIRPKAETWLLFSNFLCNPRGRLTQKSGYWIGETVAHCLKVRPAPSPQLSDTQVIISFKKKKQRLLVNRSTMARMKETKNTELALQEIYKGGLDAHTHLWNLLNEGSGVKGLTSGVFDILSSN